MMAITSEIRHRQCTWIQHSVSLGFLECVEWSAATLLQDVSATSVDAINPAQVSETVCIASPSIAARHRRSVALDRLPWIECWLGVMFALLTIILAVSAILRPY